MEQLTKSQLLEALEGQEILSSTFEGTVGIRNGQIIQYGEVIVGNPTRGQLSRLLDEAFINEFGSMDIEELL